MKMKTQTPRASALRESFFDNILDGLAYCQMIFDKQEHPVDFVCIEVNKNFEKLTRLKEAKGKKATELIPDIFRSNPELFEICGRVSLTGKPEKFETYIKPLARWFLIAVYSPKKNFFGAIFRNITDRKQIEKDLQDAKTAAQNVYEDLQIEKERITQAKAVDEAMLASIGDGLVATGKAGNIVLVNRAFEAIIGWKEAEAQGKFFSQVMPIVDEKGEPRPESERLANKMIKEREFAVRNATTYYKRKDGTFFPAALTVSPIMLGKSFIGIVEVFRDITKEKEIEKLRVDFLSLASHQLRTPLSGTKWLIETIQRGVIGKLNPRQKEYLNNIYQVNERMIKLVSDMLNVLILESGVGVIKKQKITVAKLYEELSLVMEPVARDKKVILRNALKNHKLFFLETDLQILRSILESFVSNAVNYSKKGQAVVLGAKEEPRAVVFSVKDSGIGIPAEEQLKTFERFYRASNAKKFKPDGTGLGLYIASMLAKKVGGKISFKSEENKGTTFYLRMPKKADSNSNFNNN